MEDLRVEVPIAVPPHLVWWAWTLPKRVAAWFAPEARVEARPGGPFELFFDPRDRNRMNTKGCVFTWVEPVRRLSFTWKGPDQFAALMNEPKPLTYVEVTLREEGGQTRMILEHRGWGDGEAWGQARDWHRQAWSDALGMLKAKLEAGWGLLCHEPEKDDW